MDKQQVLYLAFVDFENRSDGVVKKVKMQIKSLEQNGHNVECLAYGEKGVCAFKDEKIISFVPYKKGKARRLQLIDFALEYIKRNSKDVLYMRFAYSDPKMCSFLRKIKKYISKTAVEIATYPYRHKGMFSGDKKTWVIQAIDYLFFPRMCKYVDKFYVIGAPVENLNGVKVVNIPNGIAENNFKLKSKFASDEINIMCLASMYIYQGYDRLIQGLSQYKNNGGTGKITIHLVGIGPEINKYKNLVSECKLEKEVIFHGERTGAELDLLFDECNLACSTLAPHRNQIIYASPLKSKEYMLRGVPYVYAYKEIGIDESYPYLLHIESTEEPIKIEEIIDFFNSYKDDMEKISVRLNEYAMQKFHWSNLLKGICD